MEKENHINTEQLIELNKLEQVTISSHTKSHKILNCISENEAKQELKDSKFELENLIKMEISSLCFPEGKFNCNVIEIAKKLGYTKLYSSLPGFYIDEFFPNIKNRSLVQFSEEKEFKAILKGGDHILGLWYKFKHFSK